MDALVSHRLSGQEYQVTLYVIRKTYGFNKVCDYISMGQIADATGINRPKVALLLKNLKEKNIIGVTQKDNTVTQKDNTLLNCLYFSKDYESWKVLPKKITVTQKDNTLLPKKITEVLPKMVHTKESIKESINKYIVGEKHFQELWERYPAKDGVKMALKYFNASVKTENDLKNINLALDNYLAHLKTEEWKKPKNGS